MHSNDFSEESTDIIKLGVLLPVGKAQWDPDTRAADLLDFAVTAEGLGYDSVWANDFLLTPRIEALTMLASAAAVTTRVTLGTATLLPVLRRPVQTAQVLTSIDLLSGGRLAVAVGAAFPGPFGVPQHQLSEVPWERRLTRLDETVALWRQLWTATSATSFHGEILHFDDIPPMLPPSQAGGPPVWLGGSSPAALRRAARLYDGWMPYPPDPADYRSGLAAIREAQQATEAQTATESRQATASPDRARDFTPALFVSVAITDSVEEGRALLEEFAVASYGLPLSQLEGIQALVAGPADYVAARLREYTEAGARHLACRIATTSFASQRAQLDRLVQLKALLASSTGTGQLIG